MTESKIENTFGVSISYAAMNQPKPSSKPKCL